MAFPAVVFRSPALRGLDERGRRELELAGALREVAEGALVFRAGDDAASFFVVAEGSIAIRGTARGDGGERELRRAGRGDSFGEDATALERRTATAVALERSTVAEIPVHLFHRAAARAGGEALAAKLGRSLEREALRELFRTSALTRHLAPHEADALLDAAETRSVARGHRVYEEGDDADAVWLVASGLVQLQALEPHGRAERLRVLAYIAPGDFFGDVEVTAGGRRESSAIASGAARVVRLPRAAFAALTAARPELVPRLRRVAGALGHDVVAKAAAQHTQHAFRDLYRLQTARSLLVIDLESCVRCGHCSWACGELHGTSRLVRRGDTLVASLREAPLEPAPAPVLDATPLVAERRRLPMVSSAASASPEPSRLLVPASCQHCDHPACMIDCPTGAIGRDARGEVFVREELCTGCGACAKACPWDNVQMAERAPGAPKPAGDGDFSAVAVKCDLCREHDGPACVKACPTESIVRIRPREDLVELRDFFAAGAPAVEPSATKPVPASAGARPLTMGTSTRAPRAGLVRAPGAAAGLVAAGLAAAGAIAHAKGAAHPHAGAGLAAGFAALLATVALTAYAWPKRRVRAWMRPAAERSPSAEPQREPTRSRVAAHARAHVALGLVAIGLALAHAPVARALAPSRGGLALLAFLIASATGAATAAAYALVPRRLARLERSSLLPGEHAAAESRLRDRLYREASGTSPVVKRALEALLLPYAASALGAAALVLSGRSLREEQRAVEARIAAALDGRGDDALLDLRELVRTVVELRALRAQRALSGLLRALLPAHVLSLGVALVALAVHAATAVALLAGARGP